MPEDSRDVRPRYLNVDEAIVYLGTSRTTLYKAVREHKVPHFRDPLTGKIRFDRDALDEWMRGGAA